MVERRHRLIIAAAGILTLVLAVGLPRLSFSSNQDTMIPAGSSVARENLRYQRQFGGDPMILLLEGDVRTLLDSHNRAELTRLERELTRDPRYHAVLSPLTTLRFAAAQIPVGGTVATEALARDQEAAANSARDQAAARGASPEDQERAADAAREQLAGEFASRTAADGARLADAGPQTLDNPKFVDFLVFDGRGRIRPTFTGVFPDRGHALFVVRLAGNLDIDEIGAAASHVADLAKELHLHGVRVVATGPPLLLKEINDGMRTDMARMGAIAVAVMLVVLALVVRARWRLLSLPIAMVGIVWAFGLLGYLGIPLTMVTMSGLPILIGLGVDFVVQSHSRYEEEAVRGAGWRAGIEGMLQHLGPALSVAFVAAAAGVIALRMSRVPMIRDFGVMLAIGSATVFVAALVILPSVVAWRDTGRRRFDVGSHRVGVERAVGWLAGLARGKAALAVVLSLVVAVGGFGVYALDHTTIQSDPERFVAQDSPVLRDLRRVRQVAQSSGDFGVMVEADDIMRPEVLAWMYRFETQEMRAHPKTLFRSSSVASIVATVTASQPTPGDVGTIMSVAPSAISRTFLSRDHKRAHMIFAIGPVSLQNYEKLITSMRADMRGALRPPPRVHVVMSGLTVVGIESVNALSANRWQMTGTALAAVLLWLLIAFRRRPLRAPLALVPVLAALGLAWSVVYLLGVEVNSLTALSSPLVIAIGTEFGVLVMERYLEERRRGTPPDQAVHTAALRIGRAFTASGLATAAGFGVLAFSGFPLLSNFGTVVALNVLVVLLCSLVLFPPLLRAADRRVVDAKPHRPAAAVPTTVPTSTSAVR